MKHSIPLLLLLFLIVGCNQFIVDRNEFKDTVPSKKINLESNYQRLAYCLDEKITGTSYSIDIITFNELGIIEWRATRADSEFMMSVVNFKRINQDETEVTIYSPISDDYPDVKISIPFMEKTLLECEMDLTP